MTTYNYRATFTTLPSNVPINGTVVVQGVVPQLPAGKYQWKWDLEDSSLATTGDNDFFTAHSVLPSTGTTQTIPHLPPTADLYAPLYGDTLSTNVATLSATVYNDGTKPVTIQFQVCDADNPDSGATCQSSGLRTVPTQARQFVSQASWQTPKLNWNKVYYWRIQVQDSGAPAGPWSDVQPFIARVSVPDNGAYGTDASGLDAAGVNTYLGNFVHHATDLTVASAGTPLEINRTYNSYNQQRGVFGYGWSSIFDMRMAFTSSDMTLRVTFADGSIGGYGTNPDGSWSDGYDSGGNIRIVSTSEFRMRDGTDYKFGSYGWPVKISRNDGTYVDIVADSNGRPTQLTAHPSGRSIYLGWNTTGQINRAGTTASGTGALSLPWYYSYSTSAPYFLMTVFYPTMVSSTYEYNQYDGSHVYQVMTDIYAPKRANHEQVIYSQGRVQTVTFPSTVDGTTVSWNYDLTDASQANDPRITKIVHVRDPDSVQTWYQFDNNGLLWRKTTNSVASYEFNTHSWLYRYDGKVSGEVDEDGNPTDYYWGPYGLETTNKYRDSNHIVSTTRMYHSGATGDLANGEPDYDLDGNNNRTNYTYNAAGQLVATVAPATQGAPTGAQTSISYTCDNNTPAPAAMDNPNKKQPCSLVASVTDPDGRVTKNAYNANGDLAQTTSPTGVVTSNTFDRNGRIITKITTTPPSALGQETDYTWTATGKPATQTDPPVTNPITGATHQLLTTYKYDDDDNLIEKDQEDVGGTTATRDQKRITTYAYDSRDRRMTTTQNVNTSLQRITSSTYDGLGAPTTQTTARGLTYKLGYDLNRLAEVQVTGFTGQSYDPTTPRNFDAVRQGWSYAGLLNFTMNAMGHYTSYYYTGDGKLLSEVANSYTDPDTGTASDLITHQYGYDLAGNLTSTTDGNGSAAETILMGYDAANNRVSTTVDPTTLNRTTSIKLDAAGLPTESDAPDGAVLHYTYGGTGNQLQSQTDDLDTGSVITGYVSDGAGRPTTITMPGNATTTLQYDALGRVSTTVSPASNVEDGTSPTISNVTPTETVAYNTFGEVTDSKDANGRITHRAYDLAGEVTEVDYPSYVPPGSSTALAPNETYTYDAAGDVTAYTDRSGATTNYAYDQIGRLDKVLLPPATPGAQRGVATYRYDDGGHVISEIDPIGSQKLFTYDDLGRVRTSTQVVRQSGQASIQDTTVYSYDSANNLIKRSAGDQLTTAIYDHAGEVLSSTSSDSGQTQYGYDAVGRVTSMTDAIGRKQLTTYDKLGRIIATELRDSQGNTLNTSNSTIDGRGNVTDVKDSLGGIWHTDYDLNNRVISMTDPAPKTASGTTLQAPTTTFGYDANGNQTRTTDANGHIVRQSYNTWNLPETQTWPATSVFTSNSDRQTTQTYNNAGQLIARSEPGGVSVNFTYDALGAVLTKSGSGGDASASSVLGYDLDERLTSLQAPGGTSAVTYDDRGNVLTTRGGAVGNSTYVYDNAGRLSSQNDPSGTKTYAYLPQHRLPSGVDDSLSSLTDQLGYYADGQLRQSKSVSDTTSAVVSTENLTYSPAGRPESDITTDATGAVAVSLQYGWNAVGSLVSSTTSGNIVNPHTDNYTYDADGRLIRDYNSTAGNGVDYGWDSAGNRTGLQTWAGTPATHTTTATTSATYDERNQLKSATDLSGTTSYTYTARGTLDTTTITPSSGSASTSDQAFDAFDRIVQNGTSTYSYDSINRLVTASGKGNRFAGLGNEPVAEGSWLTSRDQNGSLLSTTANGNGGTAVTNAHGDVLAALSTTAGTVKSSKSYNAFGVTTASSGASAPIGYQGSFTDSVSGTVNAQARMYSPNTGTFMSVDSDPPATMSAADTNRFSYASGNPTTLSDPGGHDAGALGTLVNWGRSLLDEGLELGEGALEDLCQATFNMSLGDAGAATVAGFENIAAVAAEAAAAAGVAAEVVGEVGLFAACIASVACAIAAATVAIVAVVVIAGVAYTVYQELADSDGVPLTPSQGSSRTVTRVGGQGTLDKPKEQPTPQRPWLLRPPIPHTIPGKPWSVPGRTYNDGTYIYQPIEHFRIDTTYDEYDWSNGIRNSTPQQHLVQLKTTVTQTLIIDPLDTIIGTGWNPDWTAKFATAKPGNSGTADTDTSRAGGGLPSGAEQTVPLADAGGGGGKVPAKPSAGGCTPEPSNSLGLTEGDVGSYGYLNGSGQRVAYDGLEAHHTPQQALGLTSINDGAAIVLSEANHRMTRTYGGRGRASRAKDAGRATQDILNDDYNDLRGLGACFDVEHSIDAIQNYYQTNFPGLLGGS